MNFWKKKKTNHHHHHHHRENVSDNISIGREEKRRERERERLAPRSRSRKKVSTTTTTTTHPTRPLALAREREKIFEFVAQKKEEVSARNGRKTRARTLLPPPPGVVEVDFRAGFFSTSSSENRFGVGARRALFLSLILLNRKVFFVNVFGLWF